MTVKAGAVVILLLSCCSFVAIRFELRNTEVLSHMQVADAPLLAVHASRVAFRASHRQHLHRHLLDDSPSGFKSGAPLSSISNKSAKPESGRGLNPSVVIIVVILTVVFLLSGFLHLLARCCGRVAARREPTEGTMSAIHGQLQQLFLLHDAGVSQAFIDTLPVFPYKAICGLKEGTDCAVCLSEFESEDRLRLLPKCKHAFHIECIDTWLLSHTTCPLCRCALLSEDAAVAGVAGSHGVYSDSDRLGSARSMRSDGYAGDSRRTSNMSRRMMASSSMRAEHGGGSGSSDRAKDEDARIGLDSPEIQPVLDRSDSEASMASVLSVKLGRVERKKTKRIDMGLGASILRGRSYSMGSYEYVVDPANLQVIIAPTPYPGRGNGSEFAIGARPRHRTVFSDGIPELGSIPGTPTDELFWATRGLATPQYGEDSVAKEMIGTPDFLDARTPDFLFARTPDFITSKVDCQGNNRTSRLNLGLLASEAALVPRTKHELMQPDEIMPEVIREERIGIRVVTYVEKEWATIDLKEHDEDVEAASGAFSRRMTNGSSPVPGIPDGQRTASEESRVMAGLDRFFGNGWRSNVGIDRATGSMSRLDKASIDGWSSNKSKSASENERGESLKDHRSISSRAFSFRFPVPESLGKLGRSRRSFSDTAAALLGRDVATSATTTTFETASKEDITTGCESLSKTGSKDAGFETASKESLGGLDSSSVSSFETSWIAAPSNPNVFPEDHNVATNHNESNQQAASLARKTIHWLMGRDRRVQVHAASFSPTVVAVAAPENEDRHGIDGNL